MSGSGLEGESRRFLATRPPDDYRSCPFVVLGVPLDVSVSFRPGTRFAPGRVRDASWVLEEYSPALDGDLRDVAVCDLGDVPLPLGDLAASLTEIEEAARRLFADGKRPLFIGGEHSLTHRCVRAAREERWPHLGVLQFDAHLDLRDDYLRVREGHASAMRRCADVIGFEALAQVGPRSGTREEFALARARGTLMPGGPEEAVTRALERLGERPVYVSVDVDVLDPAFAPGVGTPEPAGWTTAELLAALQRVFREANVVAVDVVEVCPPWDAGDVTAVAAAKIVRDVLIAWAARQG